MVDQSGRGWDFSQVETKVHIKSRNHGGQSSNVASERSVVFREIPVLVEPKTILRRMAVEGAFGWNVRYGIVQVHEPERILARVRKNPVAERLIANPRTPIRVERNICVRESAGSEHSQSRPQAVTRKTNLRLGMTLAVIRNTTAHVIPHSIEGALKSLVYKSRNPQEETRGAPIGSMIRFRNQRHIGVVNHIHGIVRFGASKRKDSEPIVNGEVALRPISVPIADLVQAAETAAGEIFLEIRCRHAPRPVPRIRQHGRVRRPGPFYY
jgi:hypothetical protein